MKKVISTAFLICFIIVVFNGCYANNTESILNKKKSEVNKQITISNILTKEVKGYNLSKYKYSFTNGNEYLYKTYTLDFEPEDNIDTEILEYFDSVYLEKTEYLYLDGDKDSTVQINRYLYNEVFNERTYSDQYFFVQSLNQKNKLEALHSYEIGSNGESFDNIYFYCSYNEEGKLTEVNNYDNEYSYYFYDENGILCGFSCDDMANGEHNYNYSYESNEKGNITSVSVCENENLKHRYEYKYDSDNRIISEVRYSPYNHHTEERITINTTYSYDDFGNVSEINTETYNSEKEEYETCHETYYYNGNNNITKILINDKGKEKCMLFLYSETPTPYFDEN